MSWFPPPSDFKATVNFKNPFNFINLLNLKICLKQAFLFFELDLYFRIIENWFSSFNPILFYLHEKNIEKKQFNILVEGTDLWDILYSINFIVSVFWHFYYQFSSSSSHCLSLEFNSIYSSCCCRQTTTTETGDMGEQIFPQIPLKLPNFLYHPNITQKRQKFP